MAFSSTKQNLHQEPVGPGFHGSMKTFAMKLVAATPYVLYFDGFKLSDVDHANVLFSSAFTNGSSEAVGGAPATTKTIASDGKSVTLTDSSGGNFVVTIIGKWVKI